MLQGIFKILFILSNNFTFHLHLRITDRNYQTNNNAIAIGLQFPLTLNDFKISYRFIARFIIDKISLDWHIHSEYCKVNRSQMLLKIGVLKNFASFKRKHLCRMEFLLNLTRLLLNTRIRGV